jgi:DNA polymerase-3 subunit delta
MSPAGPAEETIWFVDGDDASLVGEAVSELVARLLGPVDRSLALEDFRGDELDLAVVVDACRTPPFLADRRVIVVTDIGRFSADQVQPLLAYLNDPMPTSYLVLAAGSGQVSAKLLTALKEHGGLVNTKVGNKEAHGWTAERVAKAPLKVAPAAAAVLEAHLGEDLSRLGALLETLEAAYGKGARIGADELAPYLGQPGSVPPWDLTDAIDSGQPDKALDCLHRMLGAGERHPLVVLAILHRHLGNVLRAQSPAIRTEAQAAEAMGIASGRSTYPARKALDGARRLGPRGAGDAITALADAELALKGQLDWPAELVLEVLVARLCRLVRSGATPVRAAQRR